MNVVDFFDRGFWQNIAADIAFALGTAALYWLKQVAVRWFPQTHRTWNRAYLSLLFVSLAGANFYYIATSRPNPAWFLLVSTTICFALVWREFGQFWRVGLIGGDRRVGTGLNYDKALRLCRNSVSFLGIGAAKLTRSPHFVGAMERCNRTNAPIRFLLLKPSADLLRKAAEQKGVTPQDYRRKVEDSLRRLAALHTDRHINIEVRFYPEFIEPVFRLMFINEQLCLVSYNVFGEGDGSQLPQMYIKRFEDQRDTDSFYYPFRLYFDRLWEMSERWDFQFPAG